MENTSTLSESEFPESKIENFSSASVRLKRWGRSLKSERDVGLGGKFLRRVRRTILFRFSRDGSWHKTPETNVYIIVNTYENSLSVSDFYLSEHRLIPYEAAEQVVVQDVLLLSFLTLP